MKERDELIVYQADSRAQLVVITELCLEVQIMDQQIHKKMQIYPKREMLLFEANHKLNVRERLADEKEINLKAKEHYVGWREKTLESEIIAFNSHKEEEFQAKINDIKAMKEKKSSLSATLTVE